MKDLFVKAMVCMCGEDNLNGHWLYVKDDQMRHWCLACAPDEIKMKILKNIRREESHWAIIIQNYFDKLEERNQIKILTKKGICTMQQLLKKKSKPTELIHKSKVNCLRCCSCKYSIICDSNRKDVCEDFRKDR